MLRRPPSSPLFPSPPLFRSPPIEASLPPARRITPWMRLRQRLKYAAHVADRGRYHTRTLPAEFVYGTARDRPRALHISVDRKSTRLNSSHGYISYAVFCLKT